MDEAILDLIEAARDAQEVLRNDGHYGKALDLEMAISEVLRKQEKKMNNKFETKTWRRA